MTSWRLDLTVMTDLAASMFAACFMVLLILLSLAQRADPTPPEPIEATRELKLVAWQAPTPAALVNMLHEHDGAAGTSIDLFADRIEVTTAGETQNMPAGALQVERPVRLFVFSNRFYADVRAALGDSGVTEMSVPRALRSADGHWTAAFEALVAERLDIDRFRERLAQLLAGGTEGEASASDGGGSPHLTMTSLSERLTALLNGILAIGLPLLGLSVVAIVERRRFGSGQRATPTRY